MKPYSNGSDVEETIMESLYDGVFEKSGFAAVRLRVRNSFVTGRAGKDKTRWRKRWENLRESYRQ